MKMIYKRLFFVMLVIFVANLFAAPIMNLPVLLSQPDGVTINAFQSGDEFHCWVHDEEGFTIIRDESTGFWSWAVESHIRDGDIESSGIPIHSVSAHSLGLTPFINISEELYLDKRVAWEGDNNIFTRTTPNTGTVNNIVIFIRFYDDSEFGQNPPQNNLTFYTNVSQYDAMFNNIGPGVNSQRQYFRTTSYWDGN